MGCSASRSNDILYRDKLQKPPTSTFSSCYYYSQSPSSAFSPTPVSRTLSLTNPIVHHPPLCKGDTVHLVYLTSTTYGSLSLINSPNPIVNGPQFSNSAGNVINVKEKDDSGDPLSPNSVINTWELMEGLDEVNIESSNKPFLFSKSETFDYGSLRKDGEVYEFVKHCDSRPLWQHLSEESFLAKLDRNVVSTYRKALLTKQYRGKSQIKQLSQLCSETKIYFQGAEDRIVLFYTSLRGIRRTYDECCMVRMILRGFGVFVDERDTSMDSSYRKELQRTLGKETVRLPQVFIKGKYIGGSEEIKQLHEAGVLAKLLQGIPIKHIDLVCQSCGDARFLPCPNCNGSRKVYEEEEGELKRCTDCNENGLIRCLSCCP